MFTNQSNKITMKAGLKHDSVWYGVVKCKKFKSCLFQVFNIHLKIEAAQKYAIFSPQDKIHYLCSKMLAFATRHQNSEECHHLHHCENFIFVCLFVGKCRGKLFPVVWHPPNS